MVSYVDVLSDETIDFTVLERNKGRMNWRIMLMHLFNHQHFSQRFRGGEHMRAGNMRFLALHLGAVE